MCHTHFMKRILTIAALLAGTSAQAQVPLPPPRPAEISLPKDWFNLGKAAEPAKPLTARQSNATFGCRRSSTITPTLAC
jgi:hypothetical protein